MYDLKALLFEEDRGVSPVIGVILMVAITVILAAVIATFVMNMGPSETTQPNVQWEWNNDGANVTLSHTGGDAADPNNFMIQTNESADGTATLADLGPSGDWTASNSASWDGSESAWDNGYSSNTMNRTYTLIWDNPNNDQTQEVDTFEP